MKFYGITRIRNEENIIQNTLNHVAAFVDGIFVYDDCSTDNTVEICENHSAVKKVIKGQYWDKTSEGRNRAEGTLRQIVYEEAVKNGADWVYCFDADEYIEFTDEIFLNKYTVCYYFRLFDFYITPVDVDKNYLERQWMGPEYRDIPMIFNVNEKDWHFNQRIPLPTIIAGREFGGYVKHYGKAISIKEWEKDCDYYANVRWNKPIYTHLQERWKKRKGKAIHTKSDFGRELIIWEDKNDEAKIISL